MRTTTSLILLSACLANPVVADNNDDQRIKKLAEYLQQLDQRLTRLEEQLGGSSSSGSVEVPTALGAWTNPDNWRALTYGSHMRQVQARLGVLRCTAWRISSCCIALSTTARSVQPAFTSSSRAVAIQ